MADIFTNETHPEYAAVPKISDERLAKLSPRIKPVVEKDGKLFYIKDVNPRTTAFTWDPTPTVEAEDLVRLTTIPTRHTFGAPAFFKPSIAEVLAQIPLEYLDDVVAFETLSDNLLARDIRNGWHITTTILYQEAK